MCSKFGRPFADDVDAQQLFGFAMKDHLQAAGGVAANLAARNLAIIRHADLVGDIFVGELLFGLADEGNLRDGINPVRITGRIGCIASLPKACAAAMRPCSIETDARLGNPITSPTAKICGCAVRYSAST